MTSESFEFPTRQHDAAALRALGEQLPADHPLDGSVPLMQPAMDLALAGNFGSVAAWRADFAARAQALQGRPGWVLLLFQPQTGALVNLAVADPAELAASDVPLLAMPAPGAMAHPAGEPFGARVSWAPVYQRYQHAVHEASEACGAGQGDVAGAVLVDVRRAGMYQAASAVIPGATWRDPAAVTVWATELPAGARVVVYCVYGHEVGRVTAMRLRTAGLNARYLRGGIDGWQAAGLPLQAKGATP